MYAERANADPIWNPKFRHLFKEKKVFKFLFFTQARSCILKNNKKKYRLLCQYEITKRYAVFVFFS